jgi:predicted nucleic acid-binding protein
VIIYLDMCSLKRPFDDQTQPRIALETAAVLAILQAVADGRVKPVRSLAHQLENSRNPDSRRAGAVAAWLNTLNPIEPTPRPVAERVAQLTDAGFKAMDAYHLAWAEHLQADVLVTTDDGFLSQSSRSGDIMKVRVLNPVGLAVELVT